MNENAWLGHDDSSQGTVHAGVSISFLARQLQQVANGLAGRGVSLSGGAGHPSQAERGLHSLKFVEFQEYQGTPPHKCT